MNIIERLDYPLVQAPIGSAESLELVEAVAEAGAMGTLAMTWADPDTAHQQILHLKSRTEGLFAANFVLSFLPRSLEAVLLAGAPVVTFSWGISAEHIRTVHKAGAVAGVQIGSACAAARAITAGANFLICQGNEAGGHVQSSTALADLVPAVVRVAGDTPVIAAGGIADGRDVARVRRLGAAAAMLGTRFVAAEESKAHDDYQQAIVRAKASDTSFTWCFDGDWPYSGHRVIRNATLENWEACGCPLPGNRPGEGETVATTAKGWAIPRYHIASPVQSTTGDVLGLALYAGTGCSKIEDVLPAKEIIERLFEEPAPRRGV